MSQSSVPALLAALLIAAFPTNTASAQDLPLWRIESRLDAEAAILQSRVCSAQAIEHVVFRAGRSAPQFLLQASRDSGAALNQHDALLSAADWQAGECLHTRIDLGAAARAERFGIGIRPGHYLRLAISSWLWRPQRLHADSRIAFELPEGWASSMPWPQAADGSFLLASGSDRRSAIGAFGRFEPLPREVAGSRLRIAVLPSVDGFDASAVADWLADIAAEVARVSGALPKELQVLVLPLPGLDRPVPWGEVTRGGGSAVHLLIGAEASHAQRLADWTAWHEFAHLLHPYLGERGRWLAEGLASYYQNLLRARSGDFSAAEAWARLRAGFERGQRATAAKADALESAAAARQRGSTMRVYWAGAAFWLETELRLHALDDSLSALLRRYHARRGAGHCCQSPQDFIAALDALAPEADIRRRWREYAQSRHFPLSPERLRSLDEQLSRAESPLSAVLEQDRSQATGSL